MGAGQGSCEQRREVFVKIQKKKIGGGVDRGFFLHFFFFFFWGGGGGGGSEMDVNEEMKFL